jgi:heat shock protein HslJ
MRFFPALVFCVVALCAPPVHAAPGALTGRWRIVAVSGAEGLDDARTRAEFAANGRFASTIGCNRIACPPPLDAVERHYLAALESVRGYRLEGGTLVFLNESGEALVRLAREK